MDDHYYKYTDADGSELSVAIRPLDALEFYAQKDCESGFIDVPREEVRKLRDALTAWLEARDA